MRLLHEALHVICFRAGCMICCDWQVHAELMAQAQMKLCGVVWHKLQFAHSTSH